MFSGMLSSGGDVYVRMILAGILFGLWPILKEYSGVQGLSPMMVIIPVNLLIWGSILAFSPTSSDTLRTLLLLSVLILFLFAYRVTVEHILPLRTPGMNAWETYAFLLSAGLCISFGMLAFLDGFRLVMQGNDVHMMYVPFAAMVIAQTAVPLIFHAVVNGTQLHWINWLGIIGTPLVILALSFKPS